MRRLGGRRWRLRRTRCAMGFERQSVAESRAGEARAHGNKGVGIVQGVASACRSVREPWRGNVSRWGRHTNAAVCRSTSREWS